MNGENNCGAAERLAAHLEQVENYVDLSNVRFAEFNEEFLESSNMSKSRIGKLTQQELFDNAYVLYGYSSYIQDEINKNKIALNWCDDQIEKLVVDNLQNFDQYTKHEVKKQSIIRENSYASKVDQMRSIAEARLQSLEGKVYELKRKGDILLEKGKRL
jgi:hypothetical protein|tara:strand:- start:14540 stop:15016 length:477 start_codon:yes stop_codon:yes gene_type:complete